MAAEQVRIVNLERGMPLVRDALQRLALELETASMTGCRALVLIHGYGSSGRGGAIKEAVRCKLQLWLEQKAISQVLPGEEGGRRSGAARQIAKRYPDLADFVQKFNPGITVVIM
ncbi:MAG: Smr/MutS family protein [Desulfobulbaceae bacterium]|nr:Smr/MutS family protein [Desulfobulbaceae bacterium]